MKWLTAVVLVFVLLTGCGKANHDLKRATELRERLSKSNGCSFLANITADYGEQILQFSLDCKTESNGDLTFTVVKPESIADIQGSFSHDGGQITFDDQVLAFPKLAEGELSPISSPWLIIKTLLGGYLKSCGKDDNGLRVTIDDSYEEDALQLDIWLNDTDMPFYAEILWQGRRIISVNVDNFVIL